MNIDKHIEEMAKTLCGEKHSCKDCPQKTCCGFRIEATVLYANEYRKQTEVAAEIFDELERTVMHPNWASDRYKAWYFEKLKKKYTKGSEHFEN